MLHKVRWRIAIPFVILIAVVTVGLVLYFSRSTCVSTPKVVWYETIAAQGGVAGRS